MNIYITRGGQQYGPYSEADVQAYLASGRLSPRDIAWHEDQRDWTELGKLIGSPAPRETWPTPRTRIEVVRDPPHSSGRFIFTVLATLLLLGYLVSPYIAVLSLRSALDSGDRDRLEARIDFSSVRASMKEQLRTYVALSAARDEDLKKNPFGGLVTIFAPALVDNLVDSFVTPSGMAALIADSKSALASDTTKERSMTRKRDIDWSKVRYAFFSGPTSFLFDEDGTKLHFSFESFGWKLKRIVIPLQDLPAKRRN